MKNKKLKFSSKEIFFTSDLHVSHGNIIKYCSERWNFLNESERDILENGSVEESKNMRVGQDSIDRMNETIINNINAKVGKKDALWILGDVGWFKNRNQVTDFYNQLNCNRIYLVVGNHDQVNLYLYSNNLLAGVYDQAIINVGKHVVHLNHYAMMRWDQSHHGSYHLFGHSHGQLNNFIAEKFPQYKMLDVGIDGHDFKPWSFDEINAYMKPKQGEKFVPN